MQKGIRAMLVASIWNIIFKFRSGWRLDGFSSFIVIVRGRGKSSSMVWSSSLSVNGSGTISYLLQANTRMVKKIHVSLEGRLFCEPISNVSKYPFSCPYAAKQSLTHMTSLALGTFRDGYFQRSKNGVTQYTAGIPIPSPKIMRCMMIAPTIQTLLD